MNMITPIIYSLSDYIVLQTQVTMAFCVSSDFEGNKNKNVILGSVLYWLACVVIMLAVGILDYTGQWFLISRIRMVAAWVFAIIWQRLFFTSQLSKRIFSVFYAAIIMFAGSAFCNIVDAFATEYGIGTLPWLMAHDNNIVVSALIALRRFALYFLIWIIELRGLRRYLGNKWNAVVSTPVVVLYGLLAVIAAGLFLVERYLPLSLDTTFGFYVMVFACELVFCVLALIIIVIMDLKIQEEKQRVQAEADLDMTRKFWNLERKQYEFFKDNIDIINTKCHDMRHYINGVKTGSPAMQQEMTSISKAIDAYDGRIQTGNPVCDITLTGKSMECMTKGIEFICIVDGAALRFVDEVSLYSLLGNAIENAIEHVEKIKDSDERLITLNVHRKDSMVVISVENPLQGALVIEDGLPQTSKGDKGYHGFGMKSMRDIAEHYGGGLEISTEGGFFRLNIVLPYKEAQ